MRFLCHLIFSPELGRRVSTSTFQINSAERTVMSHFAEVKNWSAGNTCDHNCFCDPSMATSVSPRGDQWPTGAGSFPKSNLWPQILFLVDLFITEFCLKPSSCRILAKGLLQSTGTNSAVTLDPGLLHSVTFALMDDVPKHRVINAYEWVSTFQSQTKILPRRRRNQQEHRGREVRGGCFSH